MDFSEQKRIRHWYAVSTQTVWRHIIAQRNKWKFQNNVSIETYSHPTELPRSLGERSNPCRRKCKRKCKRRCKCKCTCINRCMGGATIGAGGQCPPHLSNVGGGSGGKKISSIHHTHTQLGNINYTFYTLTQISSKHHTHRQSWWKNSSCTEITAELCLDMSVLTQLSVSISSSCCVYRLQLTYLHTCFAYSQLTDFMIDIGYWQAYLLAKIA